ncbi:MAG: WD40 repeat domain-containing protein, partial [Candidatus Poribacteria bacterium]|nr:WD40 repeat domain-containing protein [Candidatus Poribacteria bacterium]
MNGQKPEPYTQWGLPPGAKARLGKGAIGWLQYSPDGKQLAVTGPLGIWLYDVHTCTEVALLKSELDDRTTEPPLSWAGTTLVNLNWDNTISLWGIHTRQRQINPANHTEEVYDFALSPDGTILVTGGDNKNIQFWDCRTGRFLFSAVGHTQMINALAFSPDGKVLASGDDKTIRLWDAQNGRHLSTLSANETEIWMLEFSPNGIILASRNTNETIDLWDVETGEKRQTFTNLGNQGHFRFAPDGTLIATGSNDNTVRIWNADSGTEHARLTGHTA